MVLSDTNGKRWSDQKRSLLGSRFGDDFRAKGIGPNQPIWSVLFRRPDGNHNGFAFLQVRFDVGPCGEMQTHIQNFQKTE